MSRGRAISASLAATIVVLVVLAGALGYYAGTRAAPVETVTVTSTVVRTVTVTAPPSPAPTTPAPATPAVKLPEKIVIGGTLGLSGRYATEGHMSLWGILAAVKWINEIHGGVKIAGRSIPVEYKYYDDESKKDLVPSLYERLITVDRVHFLLAPYASSLTLAAAPVADKYGVIMLSHGGASDRIFQQGYRYVVQVLSPASKYLTGVLDMVKHFDPEAKRVAIIYKEHEFSRMVAEGAKEHAEKLGFEVVFFKSYPAGATDLTPILTELAATNPDVVIGGGHFADGQLLAKQMSELGIDVKLLAILVAPALPKFYEALGNMAEGICYPAQWEVGVKYSPEAAKALGVEWFGPTQEEFLRLFKEITKELTGEEKVPSYHAAEAAAAMLVLAKAIEEAQSLDQDAVREALSGMKIMTFFGMFQIDPETGLQVGHEMVIGQWQGGKKVIVWPLEAATGKLYYPIPTWEEKAAGKKAVP